MSEEPPGEIIVQPTPPELALLVEMYLKIGRRCRKVMECHRTVAEALADQIPERSPAEWDTLGVGTLGELFGMEIIQVPGMEPGHWRVIQHDNCEVFGQGISHERCTVMDQGRLREI